jgi:replicative DNA helicase
LLTPEHFADPVHACIYEAIARRIDAGQVADAVTLRTEFEQAGTLDAVGGARRGLPHQ